MNFRNLFILIFTVCWSLCATAATPKWQIVAEESSIQFIATLNDAATEGNFAKFTGNIAFAPDKLKASNVRIVIDTTAITAGYAEIPKTLATADWFDSKTYPQATFSANEFRRISNNKFSATGILTIRNKARPIIVIFTLQPIDAKKSRAQGGTTIKRSDFGIGQGQWAATDVVKDEVQVKFTLIAIK